MTLSLTPSHARILLTELLKDIPCVEAAALYGSVARGDVEAHSDVDLLLLCDCGQKSALFQVVKPTLSSEFRKLSLALYSRAELKFLDRSRSLFLLHLKRESDILFDRTGFLGALLSDFQPKPSYRADFFESLALLDPLRTRVANSPNEFHRLSYVYSLFRVFGVYLLAERGIYEFSKSRMAAYLSREYPYACDAIAALSGLRVLNANFFSGGSHNATSHSFASHNSLSAFASALSRLIDKPVQVLGQSYGDAVAEFTAASAPFPVLNYRLRMWFLLLVYDGLNLYCHRAEIPPLTSFEPESLEKMACRHLPPPVAAAARETLNYIRDYPLKYFLNQNAKIGGARATHTLQTLAKEV